MIRPAEPAFTVVAALVIGFTIVVVVLIPVIARLVS